MNVTKGQWYIDKMKAQDMQLMQASGDTMSTINDWSSTTCTTWACLTPLSTAVVSEKTVSVVTDSCLLGMLSAGFLDLSCFLIGKVLRMETPQWVDCSIVC